MSNELSHTNNKLVLHPYHHLKYLFVFVVFVVSGICFFSSILASNIHDKVMFLLPLFFAFFASYYLLCYFFIYIEIDDCGIMIKNAYLNQQIQVNWSKLSYGYYVYDPKGNKYLLLSQNQIAKKDQKSALRCSLRVFHKLPANYTAFTYFPIFLNSLYPKLTDDFEIIASRHICIGREDST